MHEPLSENDTNSRRSFISSLRNRSPLFWTCIGLAILAFIAIMSDQKTYRNYALVPRLGNAFGAALFFGLSPAFVVWLFGRVRSSLQGKVAVRRPLVYNSGTKRRANADIRYQENRPVDFLLNSVGLHHWICEGVLPRWRHGLYGDAIAEAARALSAATQQKLRRWDVTDLSLMQQAFSLDAPKPGTPRLRFVGDRTTQTWKSRMNGASGLAQGCYAGIRNIVAHENSVTWEPRIAIEYLMAFNILARWIDECEVHRVD